MTARRTIKIGLELRVMAGAMTGVGNYSFHLLDALVRDHSELRYAGFGVTSWIPIDAEELQRIAAAKKSRARGRGLLDKGGDRLRRIMTSRLRQSDLALKLYRQQFARTVRRQSFDLFHAFNFLPFADPGVVTLPVIYDLSFLRYPEAHPRERLRRLERLPAVLDKAPLVQTISQFSRDEISSFYGYPKERIFVAPPAASAIFKPLGANAVRMDLATLGISKNYLLAVGTLEPRKNLRTLIAAYQKLPRLMRDRTPLLVVGGKGWGELELPPGTSNLESEGNLRFLGSVSNRQLRSLYEGALALLFPSIYEGFGMPVVEALACGTPVFHSKNTSMDEITEGLAVRLPALDVEAWYGALESLIAEPIVSDDSDRMRRRARAATFDWHNSAKMVRMAYETLLRR
jgi:alpha-1,3-rhamnosyl/mannosyltransferase